MAESAYRGFMRMFRRKKRQTQHAGHNHAGVVHTSGGAQNPLKRGFIQKIKAKIPGYRRGKIGY